MKKIREMKLLPLQDEDREDSYFGLLRRLSPEDIQTITNRYKANETITSLCREYGIARSNLRRLLREAGVSPRRNKMSSKQAEQAIELYESGLTIMDVVDKVGFLYGVVNRMLPERGVIVRRRKNQGLGCQCHL